MQMSFGDWELFRTLVLMLREKELNMVHHHDEFSSGGSGTPNDAGDVESPKLFTNVSSQAASDISDVTRDKSVAASTGDVMKKPKPKYVAGVSTVSVQSLETDETHAPVAPAAPTHVDALLTSCADAEVTSLINKRDERNGSTSSALKRKDSLLIDVMNETTCLRHLIGGEDIDEEDEIFEDDNKQVSTEVCQSPPQSERTLKYTAPK